MSDATKAWDFSEYVKEMRKLRRQIAYAKEALRDARDFGATGCRVAADALIELNKPDGAWSETKKPTRRAVKSARPAPDNHTQESLPLASPRQSLW